MSLNCNNHPHIPRMHFPAFLHAFVPLPSADPLLPRCKLYILWCAVLCYDCSSTICSNLSTSTRDLLRPNQHTVLSLQDSTLQQKDSPPLHSNSKSSSLHAYVFQSRTVSLKFFPRKGYGGLYKAHH